MSTPDAERRPTDRGAAQDDHRPGDVTPNPTTSSRTVGDLGRYIEGRERQGRRRIGAHELLLPMDPEEAPEYLAEQLGSRWAGRGYLLAALEAAEGEPRYWRDHHGNKVRW